MIERYSTGILVAEYFNLKVFNLKTFLLLAISLALAGCGGGSSSSGGGGREATSVNGIVNVSGAPASYTTAAGVQVIETVQTYPIDATTCQQFAAHPSRVSAQVRYQINWNFNGQPRTSVTVVSTYPAWTPSGVPSPGLVNEWNRYITALQVHERGHRDIGVSIANRIMQSGSNTAATQIFAASQQQDETYDASTGHGRTQGASLNCA